VTTPYERVGGSDAVIRLCERFYDLMDEREPLLARLHPLDGEGRVSRKSRDRFATFLIGWLGGPEDYVKENGHPRLRMRHARIPVDRAMRDAWLGCMFQAMSECGVPAELDAWLRQRFADVAEFMRNVGEAAP
jgi:hemoglobin